MAFDLSEVLKDVSRPDTGREQIEYLPYATLLPDPNNGFSMDGIEELARSIELVGLQQPLRVREIPGAYAILSGHRRYAAIGLIRRQNPGAFADGVPCIVDRADGSSAWRELQLLLGNADNRKNTPADELRLINGVSDCIRKLEAEGYEFPGRHREWISRMVGMSNTRIGRLQAIEKHLAASLLDHFNAGDLSVTAAYRLSQEPEQIQHDVYRTLGRGINDLTEAQLEERIARAKAPAKPEPHIKDSSGVSSALDKLDAYLKARDQEDEKFYARLAQRSMEFIRALPDGCTRSEGIEALKKRFRHSYASAGKDVGYEGGPKGLSLFKRNAPPIFRTWTEVWDMLATIAFQLAVQDPAPKAAPVSGPDTSPSFRPGTPPKEGLYYVNIPLGTHYSRQDVLLWLNGSWVRPNTNVPAFCTVDGWYPLPEPKEVKDDA